MLNYGACWGEQWFYNDSHSEQMQWIKVENISKPYNTLILTMGSAWAAPLTFSSENVKI